MTPLDRINAILSINSPRQDYLLGHLDYSEFKDRTRMEDKGKSATRRRMIRVMNRLEMEDKK